MTDALPIDFDQLNLVCNNDPYDREFLVSIYLRETEKELRRLSAAIQAGNSQEVYRMSHSSAGSSQSYGMAAVVPALKQLELESREGNLRNSQVLFQEIETQFKRIRTFAMTMPPVIDQAEAA